MYQQQQQQQQHVYKKKVDIRHYWHNDCATRPGPKTYAHQRMRPRVIFFTSFKYFYIVHVHILK